MTPYDTAASLIGKLAVSFPHPVLLRLREGQALPVGEGTLSHSGVVSKCSHLLLSGSPAGNLLPFPIVITHTKRRSVP